MIRMLASHSFQLYCGAIKNFLTLTFLMRIPFKSKTFDYLDGSVTLCLETGTFKRDKCALKENISAIHSS